MVNIERKRLEFNKMKKAVKRKFKGCKIQLDNGKYTLQVNGKNVISNEWSDLQVADTVYDAYKQAYICEHWDRQKLKGEKIINNMINGCLLHRKFSSLWVTS